jgi:MinD-like ATPase involved in chromosome partitioning or flagellar assembly
MNTIDSTIQNLKDKTTRVCVWSIKGGVGKTTQSLLLNLTLGITIVTNEEHTLLENILSNDDLIILDAQQEVPQVDKKYSVIFDFAGGIHRDKRIKSAIEQSDFLIIPTTPRISDIKGLISTLKELEDDKKVLTNKKVLIVINAYKTVDELKEAIEYIQELYKEKNIKTEYPILKLKYSKALEKDIYRKKQSLKELRKSPLLGFSYKKVDEDFDEILNFINN